jgi:dTMP kinase
VRSSWGGPLNAIHAFLPPRPPRASRACAGSTLSPNTSPERRDNLFCVFITFEGIDRSGKTTQARMLAETLGNEAVLVREPGGTPAGERIRELVKEPGLDLSPLAETLLFGAARAELVERVIRPALANGRTVISDRYFDSTVAYQGGARGLGIEKVEELNEWVTDGLSADLTFLLDVAPAQARARPGNTDRLEEEGEQLQRAVADAYEVLAELHPDRYVRIDASRPVDEVHRDVLAEVTARR